MSGDKITDDATASVGAANQSRARAYNERLVLSLIRRRDKMSKSELAKHTGLSAQAVSVIITSLENDQLLMRGEPQRGKVGQPSIPLSIDPDGAFSIGLKIGRRSAELVLLDFVGQQKLCLQQRYAYPVPSAVMDFAVNGVEQIKQSLSARNRKRISGIGISVPFELWNWAENLGAPVTTMQDWKDFDLALYLSRQCHLPAFSQNDATAACGAELVFGRGGELNDFIYFFIGTFIGGGIVLNRAVFTGQTGNAGAVGSMPVIRANNRVSQLIDHASVFTFENIVREHNRDPSALWLSPDDWSQYEDLLQQWIATTAAHLSIAIASSCAVIDFAAVVIDGSFPADVRSKLVSTTQSELDKLNLKGITPPSVLEGQLGASARAVGAACLPLYSRYLLDQNVLFK